MRCRSGATTPTLPLPDQEKLRLVLPSADACISLTHRSFGQLYSVVGAPAAYLRQLPAPLAGINMQYGLTNHRAEQIKTMEVADGRTELRAVTGPDYGRIYDHKLVSATLSASRDIPFEQADAQPVERAPRQGRRVDRGTG